MSPHSTQNPVLGSLGVASGAGDGEEDEEEVGGKILPGEGSLLPCQGSAGALLTFPEVFTPFHRLK